MGAGEGLPMLRGFADYEKRKNDYFYNPADVQFISSYHTYILRTIIQDVIFLRRSKRIRSLKVVILS
jgi:hypothetical protein